MFMSNVVRMPAGARHFSRPTPELLAIQRAPGIPSPGV
jgi:hypothetical protein